MVVIVCKCDMRLVFIFIIDGGNYVQVCNVICFLYVYFMVVIVCNVVRFWMYILG